MSGYDDDEFIDITGIDLAELLVALYRGTKAIGLGRVHNDPGFYLDSAHRAIAEMPVIAGVQWFDYVAGRPIKIGIRGTRLLRAALYDRDCPTGPGSAQRIVDEVRSRSVEEPE